MQEAGDIGMILIGQYLPLCQKAPAEFRRQKSLCRHFDRHFHLILVVTDRLVFNAHFTSSQHGGDLVWPKLPA